MSGSIALTPALEDYLEAIYVLQKVKEIVKVVDIAEHLKVTMPSVTGGLRRLAELECVMHEKWRRVKLTDEGERLARRINRRHEDLYSFYHEILGVEKDMAGKAACKVEHILEPAIIERTLFLTRWIQELPVDVKSEFTRRMRADMEAREHAVKPRTLDEVEPGAKAVVSKINVRGELGRRLLDMGIIKGVDIEVIKVAPLGDPIEVRLKGYHLSLRKSEAKNIEVEK